MCDPKPLSPEHSMAVEVLRRQSQGIASPEMLEKWLEVNKGIIPPIPDQAQEEMAANLQLQAEGIQWPSGPEIRERVRHNREAMIKQIESAVKARAREAAEAPKVQPQDPAPPTSKPKRRRGRPRKDPVWLSFVAELYAQGVPLRKALRKYSVVLTKPERRNIYRWKAFLRLVAYYKGKNGV